MATNAVHAPLSDVTPSVPGEVFFGLVVRAHMATNAVHAPLSDVTPSVPGGVFWGLLARATRKN